MCRLIVACCLLATLFSPASIEAGKLASVRAAVRNQPQPEEPGSRHEAKPEKSQQRPGKLADVRQQARRVVSKQAPRPSRRRSGRSYSHPVAPSSWFGFSLYQPCYAPACTPSPVTYVYETPVCETLPPVDTLSVGPAPYSPPQPLRSQFASFPYADFCEGFMTTTSTDMPLGKPWLGRVEIETGEAGEGLNRTAVGFMIEGDHGFGVDFDWNTYSEELAGEQHDELHLGDLNLLYRIVETDRVLVRAGVGVSWMGDAYGAEPGVNFTLKADFAPVRPMILSGEVDLGMLGNAQSLHLAATAGVMIDRLEVFGGYDYRRIGDVELKGPMIGLRLWW